MYTTDEGKKDVIGRELHEKLEIDTKYTDWLPRMAEYGFEEGKDYSVFWSKGSENIFERALANSPQQASALGWSKNHILSLSMAKHISMIQRTPHGMEIRQKLIDLEEEVVAQKQKPTNMRESLPDTYLDALRALVTEVEEKK